MAGAGFSAFKSLAMIGAVEQEKEEIPIYNLAIVLMNSLITKNKKVKIFPKTSKLIFE